MLEIIIMIGVMGWFWRTAQSGGRGTVQGILWVIVGGLSYFVPAKLFSFLIYPALVQGSVNADNYLVFVLIGAALSIAAGAGCCLLARKVLLSRVEAGRARDVEQEDVERESAAEKYFALLTRTVAKLDDNTAAARGVLYDRARGALVKQLSERTPARGDTEIARERAALEQAIAKVEAQAARPAQVLAKVPAATSRGPFERDNIGTRYETNESVQNFWTPYFLGRPKFPFIFYDMPSRQDALNAMLALPPIKLAADSGKPISSEVLQFGVYPLVGDSAASWGFFLAGDGITPALYDTAIAACKKYNGRNPRVSDPPQRAAVPPARAAAPSPAAVTFEREEKVDMLAQMAARGITLAGSEKLPPQIAVKRYYKAPSKDAALAFLRANPVDKPFYYLVVHTPDGVVGRDKDGIYDQQD